MKRRILSLVLVLALALTMVPAMSIAALAETINDDNVFVMQSEGGKCTLASTVMMLRRRAIIDGNAQWESISESSLSGAAWIPGTGLNNNFSYMGMTVHGERQSVSADSLRALLSEHPEGVVIYDSDSPSHAVLLTDYDEDSGTFYCADPAVAAKRIKLADSYIAQNRGSTQSSAIAAIDKVWQITNKSGGGPGLITVSLDANVGVCSQSTAYVAGNGAIKDLPTPTRTGFKFLGWFDAREGGSKIENGYKPDSNMTVYAHWEDLTVRGSVGALSWSLNREIGTLKISGSGKMPDFKSAADTPWSAYGSYVTRLELGAGVRSVGDYAFAGLTSLASADCASSVLDSLGTGAFSGCVKLEALSGFDSVKIILSECFSGCKAMTASPIPAGCTSIGALAFSGTRIENLTVPAGVGYLGAGAFKNCLDLETVTLPTHLAKVSSELFAGCTALKNVAIGSDADTGYTTGSAVIEPNAFSGCTELKNVSIYNRAENLIIDKNAFFGCTELKSMMIDCRRLTLNDNALPAGANMYYVHISGSYGSFAPRAFEGVTTPVIYPLNSTGWDESVRLNYGGSLSWEGEDNHTHDFKITVTAPTCSENGYTTYECTGCKEKFVGNETFKLGHDFVNGKCSVCGVVNPFTDLNAKGEHIYYVDSILWASSNGITTGTSDTEFSPDASCTRAQVVTFLWRAAGKPEPSTSASPFTDIYEDSYYFKAVLWAVENGITTGTSNTEFSPEETCTRAQFVTFLWRYEGEPVCGDGNPFTDLYSDAYYYKAVLWAAENGVAYGNGDGTFAPDDRCSRAQVVTFLARALAK